MCSIDGIVVQKLCDGTLTSRWLSLLGAPHLGTRCIVFQSRHALGGVNLQPLGKALK